MATQWGVVFLIPYNPGKLGVGDMNYTVVVLGGTARLSTGLLLFSQVWWEETGSPDPVSTIHMREGSPRVEWG